MAVGSPDYAPRMITSASADEDASASVTSTDTVVSFSQQVKSFIIYNDGPYAVHFNRDNTATTSNFKIPPKAWFMSDVPVTNLHLICASGETATVFVKGVY